MSWWIRWITIATPIIILIITTKTLVDYSCIQKIFDKNLSYDGCPPIRLKALPPSSSSSCQSGHIPSGHQLNVWRWTWEGHPLRGLHCMAPDSSCHSSEASTEWGICKTSYIYLFETWPDDRKPLLIQQLYTVKKEHNIFKTTYPLTS